MPRALHALIIALPLLMMCTVAFATDSITWHPKYNLAREEAQRTGKPMFIAFRCAP